MQVVSTERNDLEKVCDQAVATVAWLTGAGFGIATGLGIVGKIVGAIDPGWREISMFMISIAAQTATVALAMFAAVATFQYWRDQRAARTEQPLPREVSTVIQTARRSSSEVPLLIARREARSPLGSGHTLQHHASQHPSAG